METDGLYFRGNDRKQFVLPVYIDTADGLQTTQLVERGSRLEVFVVRINMLNL